MDEKHLLAIFVPG